MLNNTFVTRSRSWALSLTLRLTLLFALVSTVVLLVLGVVIGRLVDRHFAELDAALLSAKLAQLQYALQKVQTAQELAQLPQRLEILVLAQSGQAMLIRRVQGTQTTDLFVSGEESFPETLLLANMQPSSEPLLWSNAEGQIFRGLATNMSLNFPDAPVLRLAVAIDTVHHTHFMQAFQWALWAVVAGAALLSGLFGWLAARRGLAPLRLMRQTVADINAKHLDQRLPVHAIPLELAEVAETLNAMLARLEASFRRLSDFSSDLAHELRTPVSNLLTQTQVTLSRERTGEEYADVLASNAEEFERLSRMIADMLFLAKADHELVVPRPESLDLRAEIETLFAYYEVLAEEKTIQLQLAGQAHVLGDRLMLRRALANVLGNALQHTPRKGRIRVTLAEAADEVSVSIENNGETIPAEHLPRLFDRFYRVDAARRRHSEGAGLGLAISLSIARAHGGQLSVASANERTSFVFTLPVSNKSVTA